MFRGLSWPLVGRGVRMTVRREGFSVRVPIPNGVYAERFSTLRATPDLNRKRTAIVGNGISAMQVLLTKAAKGDLEPITVIGEGPFSWWASMKPDLRMGQSLHNLVIPFSSGIALPPYSEPQGDMSDYASAYEFNSHYLDPVRDYLLENLNIRFQNGLATSVSRNQYFGTFAVETQRRDSSTVDKQTYSAVHVTMGPGAPRRLPPQVIFGEPNPSLKYSQLITANSLLQGKTLPTSAGKIAVVGSGTTACWAAEQLQMKGYDVVWFAFPADNIPDLPMGGRRNQSNELMELFSRMLGAEIVAVEFCNDSDLVNIHYKTANDKVETVAVCQVVTALGNDPHNPLAINHVLDDQTILDKLEPEVSESGRDTPDRKAITSYGLHGCNLDEFSIDGSAVSVLMEDPIYNPEGLTFSGSGHVPVQTDVAKGISATSAGVASSRDVDRFALNDTNLNLALPWELRKYFKKHTRWPTAMINEVNGQILEQRCDDFRPGITFEQQGFGLAPEEIQSIIANACLKHGQAVPLDIKTLAAGKGRAQSVNRQLYFAPIEPADITGCDSSALPIARPQPAKK